MIDQFAKEYLHSDLRDVRETMLWKLEGVGEYDARRPLTSTGTNLLGLIKHLTITEAWYFGEGEGLWTLYFGDSRGKWTRYFELEPRQPIDVIINELDTDPTVIFWG